MGSWSRDVRGDPERGRPQELRPATVLGVILTLKLAVLGSFAAGWFGVPFDERYAGYLYVNQGHRYRQTQEIRSRPLERLAPFDGQWYREIASEGYAFEASASTFPSGWRSYAFFPAFPLVSALAGAVGIGALAGGLLVNQVLSIASGMLLFFLARRATRNDRASVLAVVCFYLYPTAGFFNLFYSESLFVFLLLWHVLLVERGGTWGTVVAGILAGLCRPQGVLLAFWHLGKLADRSASLKRALIAGSSPVVGFLLFWGTVSWRTESARSLFEVQATWGRNGSLGTVVQDLAESVHGFSGWILIVTLSVAVFAFVLALILTARERGSLAWTMLSLSMIAVPLATGSTTSMARFLLPNVPQYIVLGMLLRARPVLQLVVLGVFGCLQGIANVHLVSWRWIA